MFQPAKVVVEKNRPSHLDMSDEQIDKTYFNFGKADRKRMKKEALRERQRGLTMLALDCASRCTKCGELVNGTCVCESPVQISHSQ